MKANEVRIIGGAWRSRRIRFPARADLRPTPDRVRETVFNWLGQDLSGFVCLDLFAGSGALGFEAASRGAQHVVMVERDRAAYAALIASRQALGASQVEVVKADALEFVRGERRRYDLIFLDPPFGAGYRPRLLALLPPLMVPEGWLYCESGTKTEWPPGWTVCREGRAGQVIFQLVKWTHDGAHRGLPRDLRSGHAGP